MGAVSTAFDLYGRRKADLSLFVPYVTKVTSEARHSLGPWQLHLPANHEKYGHWANFRSNGD